MSRELVLILDRNGDRSDQLQALIQEFGYQPCACRPDSPHMDLLPLPLMILVGSDPAHEGWEAEQAKLARRFRGVPIIPTGGARFGTNMDERRRSLLAIVDQCLDERVQPPVGVSGAMQSLRTAIEHLAATEMSVLITGEPGSGKQDVAQRIHRLSARSERPFVAVDCGSVPRDLLDQQLFGLHVAGPRAQLARKPGRFDWADGGTLYLGNIDRMASSVQLKLVQSLDNRTIQRVNGKARLPLDVRVMAGTGRNLAGLINQGHLRKDLGFRLNGFPLRVPALHERSVDIPFLVDVLIRELERGGWPRVSFSASALDCLCRYSWPGNVSELTTVIEGLCVQFPDSVIGIDDLPSRFRSSGLGVRRRGTVPTLSDSTRT